MNEVLLSAGVAAIIIAVAGGGAQAFGVRVPVLNSLLRQGLLGLVGIGFLVMAFVVGNGGGGGNNVDPKVLAYRQDVQTACRYLQGLGPPTPDAYGMFDHDPFLAFIRGQYDSSGRVLADLWSRPVPQELRTDRAEARNDANDLLRRARETLDRLAAGLPQRFDLTRGLAFLQQLNSELHAPAARLDASLRRLAGTPCAPSVGGSS